MKRFITSILVVTAFLSVGCRHKTESLETSAKTVPFTFSLKADSSYFVIPDIHMMGLENKYSVEWPDEGMLTSEAERELLTLLFDDSTASSFDEAASRWVSTNGYVESFGPEAGDMEAWQVDSKPDVEDVYFCNDYVDSKIEENGNLLGFSVYQERYMGGAHGIHYFRYLTYDRNKERMIRLSDLVDTTDFGEVVVRAIEDLEINKPVRECLLEEDLSPRYFFLPEDFYIDSTRSTITLVYQVYEIACYACGTQEVVLPIFWLSKHRNLTPYAKEIFGEGCSL